MARQGLNCTLSYSNGTNVLAYQVRCSSLQYGYEMIAAESQSRVTKAYYPHRTAPTQFSLTIDLIGQDERVSLNGYLTRYANYILDPGLMQRRTPQMTVVLPSRNFKRIGVPVRGWEFGDVLGAMTFQPTLIFETSGEPLDWNEPYYVSKVYGSRANTKDPQTNYFYPTGTQLKGNEAPQVPGLGAIQEIVNSSGSSGSSPSPTDPSNPPTIDPNPFF